ncbi:MAG: CsbD family protein [Acidimicrobiales bacterium]
MQVGTIDVNKLRGVTDKGLGLGKELVGVLVGSDKLQQEGEAQQERATAELKALRDEAKAQKFDAKADVLEARQRTAQRSKSD